MSTSSTSLRPHLRRVTACIASGSLMAVLAYATPSAAGTVAPGGMGYVRVDVTSIKEARFKDVIKQQFDFSCGSAALATLLTYHYDFAVTEMEIFDSDRKSVV